MNEPSGSLDAARQQALLSLEDLWIRYFGLGGYATRSEVRAYLIGTSSPSSHDHDLLAQALNEKFTEMDLDMPVPYSHP